MDLQKDGGVDDADDNDVPNWDIDDEDLSNMFEKGNQTRTTEDSGEFSLPIATKQAGKVIDFLVPEIWNRIGESTLVKGAGRAKPIESLTAAVPDRIRSGNSSTAVNESIEEVADVACGSEQEPRIAVDPEAEMIDDLVFDMSDGKPGPRTLALFADMDFSNPKVLSDDQKQSREFLSKVNAALRATKGRAAE